MSSTSSSLNASDALARDAEHPDRAGAEQERRHELAAQTEREELLVSGVLPVG